MTPICGLVVVKDRELAERVAFHQNAAGAVLGPQDSWLTIRGLKTLSVVSTGSRKTQARLRSGFIVTRGSQGLLPGSAPTTRAMTS